MTNIYSIKIAWFGHSDQNQREKSSDQFELKKKKR